MHSSGWWRYISYDESKGKAQIDRELLWRVFGYARPHLFAVAIVLVTIVTNSLLELLPPLLYRELIDHVLPERNMTRLNWLALGLLAIPLATGLISVVNRYYSSRAGEGIIHDLRQQMYGHLQAMSLRFFTETKSGEIYSRLNNDVVGAQNAITGTIPNILTNSVTLISTLAVMISIEWRLAVLAVIVLPLFLLPARRVALILRSIRRAAMEHQSDMSNSISETLTINGALLVKTFGRQQQELARFGKANAAVRDIGVRRAQVGQWFFLGLGSASAIGTALIYWAGGYLVLQETISVGTIVAFVAYLSRLYGPITALTNVQVEFATSMVSFERVFEWLDLPIEIIDKSEAIALDKVQGRVRFDAVSFRYGGNEAQGEPAKKDAGANGPAEQDEIDDDAEPVRERLWALENVNFEMAPGELVALVGPSGAGKTTITYLLPRLYDPTEGRILLDGYDLRDVTQESLAQQIGMVTQETYLFHDTIRANLLYARPAATEDELDAACRAANIADMIARMPEGYDTVVGERGYRLSGGEKQRLAIARVILKDPQILILDEATSHLDSQSEALIQAALEPLMQGRTSLVIAHRLSTILAADKILVLDQGRLVEQGTHGELLAHGGLYAHLYETQFAIETAARDDLENRELALQEAAD
ncbi:MAG: ABC transporter ATP-binding protein [Caldilineaceae bacterium]|nr:ABC transporter ATP-binding protein [Caldilineaceae bacterium]